LHSYPNPGMFTVEEGRAQVLGEFGGLGLPVAGHTWQNEKNWGYISYKDTQELTNAYLDLMFKLRPLVDKGLCAAVYTQTSDVEVEVNGLLTYDRAVFKMDKDRLLKAHQKLHLPMPPIQMIVPTSQKEATDWRYTTDKPAENWFKPDFDDSNWKTGKGGFGTAGTPGAVVATEWKTDRIWLRRTFQITWKPTGETALLIHHDDDAIVYLNGVPAANLTGYTREYGIAPINPAAAMTLKQGQNTIAVHCRQNRGGQFIDAGLVEIMEQK